MNQNGLDIVAAEVQLGLIEPEELHTVASKALEDGIDSPALVSLAGDLGADASHARCLFERAMVELNLIFPSVRDAVVYIAKKIASEIISGTIPSYAGAKRIWDLSTRVSIDQVPELHPFVYAADEWEERPEDRAFFEQAILSEARALVGK